ncbi:hypothetical protein ANN_16808, partial [Periplaneta americana]
NVVVYVSNDNFAAQAYATAVNQHNVSASYPQQQSQQNGATAATFAPSTQSVAPLGAPIKNLKPPLIKTQDFPTSNGLIGNVSLPQQASFYASTNTPGGIVQTNGFHHGHGSNVINNIAYSSNNVGHSGAILNQGFGSGTSVKGLVNLGGHPGIGQQQAVCPNSIELPSAVIGSSNEQICNGYSVVPQPSQAIVQQQQQQQRVAVSCAQTFFSGPDQKNNAHNEAGGNSSSASQALATTNFITTTQVWGAGRGNSANTRWCHITFSTTARKYRVGDGSPPNAAALNNNNMIQQANQPVATSVPVQPVVPTITVPFGWKRLHINGAIVYIRSVRGFVTLAWHALLLLNR